MVEVPKSFYENIIQKSTEENGKEDKNQKRVKTGQYVGKWK